MEPLKHPDFMSLFQAWRQLPPGPMAELRRCASPEALLSIPAFYRLCSGRSASAWEKAAYQRVVFCLPCVHHSDHAAGLGKALTTSARKVSEKRLFQVLRSEPPNDMVQLRRIMQMVEPTVHWPTAATLFWYWNDRSKRDLLEDYFVNQP